MKLVFPTAADIKTGCVLTFGNFDGVHLGHQALLERLNQVAQHLNLPTVVVLFEPQPCEFFKKNQAPDRILSLRDKVLALKQFGIDSVCCVRFSEKIARSTASEFVETILFRQLHAKYIVVGEDARFGYNREGDFAKLQQLGLSFHIPVALFSNHLREGSRVSSTLIRKFLQEGKFLQAEALMGRPYQICGRVIYGEGRGRQLGIPTANLNIRVSKPVLTGVFAVHIQTVDGRIYSGVANWGKRPTFGPSSLYHLEVHGFKIQQELYGQWLTVTFLKKLRDEMQFQSVQHLIDQIHQDMASAQSFFDGFSGVIHDE